MFFQFRADPPRGDADNPRKPGNICGDALRTNRGGHFEIRKASLTQFSDDHFRNSNC